MTSVGVRTPALKRPGLDRYGRRIFMFIGRMALLNLSVLLVAAGTWGWWNAWAQIGFMALWQTDAVIVLMRRDGRLPE